MTATSHGTIEPKAVGSCSFQLETGSGLKRACGKPVHKVEVVVQGLDITMPKYFCEDGHESVGPVNVR